MVVPVEESQLRSWGESLVTSSTPLVTQFRALWGLHHAAEPLAIDLIGQAFVHPSALLKHELAYVLGQKGDLRALPILTGVLEDASQECIVRHEAAEALGALGNEQARSVLEKYKDCPIQEIAETCQLALCRLSSLSSGPETPDASLTCSTFASVDPAPPLPDMPVLALQKMLTDTTLSLFERYRAMFTLRNKACTSRPGPQQEEAVLALCQGFYCSDSALFRHEVAFVLGQLAHQCSIPALRTTLAKESESCMVRHECAEALGSIATPECRQLLKDFLKDPEPLVMESCVVALDMAFYTSSDQFQYAFTPYGDQSVENRT